MGPKSKQCLVPVDSAVLHFNPCSLNFLVLVTFNLNIKMSPVPTIFLQETCFAGNSVPEEQASHSNQPKRQPKKSIHV